MKSFTNGYAVAVSGNSNIINNKELSENDKKKFERKIKDWDRLLGGKPISGDDIKESLVYYDAKTYGKIRIKDIKDAVKYIHDDEDNDDEEGDDEWM